MNNILYGLLPALLLTAPAGGNAQTDDLLGALGDQGERTEHVTNAFKSSRVINAHSIEMLPAGVLDFRILHRFGRISDGAYDLFGLDRAAMRLGLDYGVTSNFSVGAGRSTLRKEVDGFVKYRVLWQSTGQKSMPVSLVWVSGITVNGLKDVTGEPALPTTFARRLAYYHQVLVGRRFSERFSLQLSPTLVHRNIVENELTPNELYALGLGGRFKFSRRVALVWDYSYAFNRYPNKLEYNPGSIGVDIETGGHVFQLHFSNTAGMNERAFLAENNGSWGQAEIQFGFNLSRVFQVREQRL